MRSDQYENLSVSGTGFRVNGNNSFESQLINYDGDRTAITDIVICGGINDSTQANASGYTNLIQNIRHTLDYCVAQYPNAICYIGYIGGILSWHTVTVDADTKYMSWAKAAYQGAIYNKKWCRYLNGVENALHVTQALYSSDGIHPNSTGADAIGSAVAQAILAGSCSVSEPTYAKLNVNSTYISSVEDEVSLMVNDDRMTCFMGSAATGIAWFHMVNGKTFSGKIRLGDFGSRHNINKPISFSVIIQCSHFDNKNFQEIPGQLTFENNYVDLAFCDIKDDGSAYREHTVTATNSGGTNASIWILANTFDITWPYFN